MDEHIAPTGKDDEAAAEAGADNGASHGILVEEQPGIERIELDTVEESSADGLGWEITPAADDAQHAALDDALDIDGYAGTVAEASLEESAEAASEQLVQIEEEELRLAAEITELRRNSAARERQLEADLAAARAMIAERDEELSGQVAQIASLTLECGGLRAMLRSEDGPSVAVGRLGPHSPQASEDLVARLKQRLEERGRAIALAREENEQLARECARLRQALGMRPGPHADPAPSQAGPFGRGVMRLLKRVRGEESAATAEAAYSGAPGSEVPTVVVEESVQARRAPDTQPGLRQQPSARQSGASPEARPALRRYLIALDPDRDDVHELQRPRMNVGRGDDADLRLTDATVSRFHALVTLVDGRTMVEDASSTNGVFVNNVRVRRAVLRDGDTVAFGTERYQFRIGPDGVREATFTGER